MAFLPGLFGGPNQVGFFGGGQYVPQQQNFNLPGFNDTMSQNEAFAQQALTGSGNDAGLGAAQKSLMGQLNGTNPSVAQNQLQQSTNQNVANAYAMAAANGNNPAAARMAVNSAGNINQQGAGNAALLRAQEVQNAQSGLMQLGGEENQIAQGYLGQNLQAQEAQQQGMENYSQQGLQGFQGAQQNAIGGKLLSGLGSAVGAGMMAAAMSQGGLVPHYDDGGEVTPSVDLDNSGSGPNWGKVGASVLKSMSQSQPTAMPAIMPVARFQPTQAPPQFTMPSRMAEGGYAEYRLGGGVPGGDGDTTDSYGDDTVRALLSPGEVVLPKSVTQSKDAEKKAAMFVHQVRMKHARRRVA